MVKKTLRRITAALMLCAVIAGVMPETAYTASVVIRQTGYSWSSIQQGYRFSVYDFVSNRTIKSMDVFSEDSAILDPYKSHKAQGTATRSDDSSKKFKYVEASYLYLDMVSRENYANVRVGNGCKLEYLYRYYESGERFAQFCKNEYNSFCTGVDSVCKSREKPNYSVYSLERYKGGSDYDPNDPIIKYDAGFMPIWQEKADDFNNLSYYKPNRDISKELRANKDGILVYILANLGFSTDDTLTYFNPEQYVMVIEPIFWFFNRYRKTREDYEFFYGTVTEWAIYDQATSGNGVNYYDGRDKYSIRNIMGRLISLAGPISTINSRNKYVEESYGIVLNSLIVTSEEDAEKCLTSRPGDEDILKYWGYDTIALNQFNDLFIDIVSSNTEFIAGEEAILAFVIGQNTEYGDAKTFAPDIRDCAGDIANISEGDYGLKLTVETTNSYLRNGERPDIKPGDVPTIVLTCDGMPAENYEYDTSPFNTTLCWGRFTVPDKAGTWKIAVSIEGTIYDPFDTEKNPRTAWNEWFSQGSVLGTNNGYRRNNSGDENRETDTVYFEITIRDAETQSNPSNPNYNDTMPADFTVKTIAEAEAELPAINSRVSWSYWKLTDIVEQGFNALGEPEYAPRFDLITEEASLDMENRYFPCSYGNLPGAEMVRYNGENVLKIRSGYGFGVSMNMNDSGIGNSITARKVYVNNTEIENKEEAKKYYSDLNLNSIDGFVKLPEHNYGSVTAELVNNRGIITMRKNPFSKYYNTTDYSKSDYSRVHFTPVWYPDGEYNILVQTSIWTPKGKLSGYCFNTILIDGSVYDDWYVTRIRS